MRKHFFIFSTVLILFPSGAQAFNAMTGGTYNIPTSIMSGGVGAMGATGSYQVNFTLGQPAPIEPSGSVTDDFNLYNNYPGFWNTVDMECNPIPTLWVVPKISWFPANDTNNVVFFDYSSSSCHEKQDCVNQEVNCEYEFDFGDNGLGSIVGGNGTNIIVYEYVEAGDYTTSLTMTELDSNTVAVANVSVTAKIVETPLPALDVVSDIDNANVTLSITDPDLTDSDVDSVTVFWADRYRSEYTWPLTTNIEHTYTRTGTDYHIRVKMVNTAGEEFNYTFINNEALIVSIP